MTAWHLFVDGSQLSLHLVCSRIELAAIGAIPLVSASFSAVSIPFVACSNRALTLRRSWMVVRRSASVWATSPLRHSPQFARSTGQPCSPANRLIITFTCHDPSVAHVAVGRALSETCELVQFTLTSIHTSR